MTLFLWINIGMFNRFENLITNTVINFQFTSEFHLFVIQKTFKFTVCKNIYLLYFFNSFNFSTMTHTSDAVWNYFKKSSERKTDSTKTKQQHFLATCNYCETTLSRQPKIMKAHLKNCPNVPSEIKEKYSLNPENKEQEISNNNSSIKKKKSDIKIAHAFYANGIPLAVVENSFFIQALHQINPKYNPLSRKVLSTSLLEKEYKQVSTDIKKLVKNANYICLTSDGWTNIHQELQIIQIT